MIYFIRPFRQRNTNLGTARQKCGCATDCGFAVLGNAVQVFPHGQRRPFPDFLSMANVSSRKHLLPLQLAETAKCGGVVGPSSAGLLDVLVCDRMSGTFPYSFLV